MKKIVLLVLLIVTPFLCTTLHAQEKHKPTLDQVFGTEGEVYFKFAVSDKAEADILTKVISIDNVRNGEVFAYANRNEFDRFLDYGIGYTVLTHPGKLIPASELIPPVQVDAPTTIWNFYPSYQQYLDFMTAFAADNPEICRLDTIGYTVQNRLLLALKISDNVNEDEGEPQFMYTSSIHGDETTGYVLMLHLIDHMLAGYGTDPRLTGLIDSMEIFINPLANPDGTYHGGNNSVYGAQRYNANNIDLNRNYPDPADGPHPDGNAWQAETEAFMAWADTNHFVMSANFHGGTSVLNYPWDTWAKLTADDAWWRFVCREYVDTVHLYSPGSYYSGYDNGITNGYAWYRITGGRQDYMNYWHSCREVTNEISDTKLLPANQLLSYWEYNYRSLLNYIEEARYGAQGTVTDSVTGEPLQAKAFIFGHDLDNSYVFSKLPSGYYSRLLIEGTYNISFSSPGYFSKLVTGVEIVNRERTQLDVQLVPLNIGTNDAGMRKTSMVFPNPSEGSFRLLFPTVSQGEIKVEIFNQSAIKVFGSDYHGNPASVRIDLGNAASGLYVVRVICSEGVFEDRILVR